ncbi:MAG: hypothetical protein II319_04260, partial [Clostridia bacterium]|nr:hypothetical protein [Clostridia bacterium]
AEREAEPRHTPPPAGGAPADCSDQSRHVHTDVAALVIIIFILLKKDDQNFLAVVVFYLFKNFQASHPNFALCTNQKDRRSGLFD